VTTGCPGCSRHFHAPAPTKNPHWEIAHANSMLITTAHCSPLSPEKQARERERERNKRVYQSLSGVKLGRKKTNYS